MIGSARRVLATVPLLVLLGASLTAAVPASGANRRSIDDLRLARILSDGAVLQRRTSVPVWGWAAPGAEVSVLLHGTRINVTRRAVADSSGAWRVEFSPMEAGGPYNVRASSGAQVAEARRLYIGDVWVASGQSNMEWRLADAAGGANDVAQARDTLIREFAVPHKWSWMQERDVSGGQWLPATPAHAGQFSAVAYHFAREVRKATGVPIGIVHASWGGSALTPWMSRSALGLDSASWLRVQQSEQQYQQRLRDSLRVRLGGVLPDRDGGLVDGRALWANPDFDDAVWQQITVPSPWERAGLAGLDGVAWYRTQVELTTADLEQSIALSLGAIDDEDVTWVNGVEVGRTSGYNVPRRYVIPKQVLRAGKNVIAVRVRDGGGDGGITGPARGMGLQIGNTTRALPTSWRFRVGEVSLGEDGQHVNKIPSVLHQAMIRPLLNQPITGVIWYQGESNANSDAQAREYAPEFAALIRSWRQEWRSGRKDFPFFWVQLANFGAPDTLPPRSGGWALLRESQQQALMLPNTGQAVSIDIGDAWDIHPRNKRDVGHRLALLARKVAYGESAVVTTGPQYQLHTVRGSQVDVQFGAVGAGLSLRGDATRAFALAGADGQWHWASATAKGNTVTLTSAAVREPQFIRYAWANSPAGAMLFGSHGLPTAPFRTDTERWVSTWQAAPQLVEPRNMPPAPGLAGSTLRQVIHLSVGGERFRFRFSNAFGNGPVEIAGTQVALSAGAHATSAGTSRAVLFNGKPGVTIPVGAVVESDPVALTAAAMADLTITSFIAQAPSELTGHPGSRTTSFLQSGDHTADASMPDAVRTEHWYLLSGIDVVAGPQVASVAIIGNSITDGRGSTTDKNNRWPDQLSKRLQAAADLKHVAVLNAGIGGNCVLRACLGPSALDRIERDVFAQHGLQWAVVFEGVNDLGGARDAAESQQVARDLIAAYQVFIARARARGVRIYGATILPFGGSQYDTPDHEAARQTVNQWVRTSNAFDGVIDFDAALRDPAKPTWLVSWADSGDHLHPGEAGHRAMGDAVDLALFKHVKQQAR
ncbi:MAG: beta galactosidase jelly roll domain-containing protein [Gemmatimonadaceae bacterium]|nr:beta galactosidase jelly roll domain-containing protein [Gemmatimonadaceae bacterium]